MVEKSKYEIQMKKMEKARNKFYKMVAIFGVIFYAGVIGLSYTFGLPPFYMGQTFMIGVVLIILGFVAGMHIQNELNKKLIPPPSERESPEMSERVINPSED